jgi:hypothetical protein
MPACDLVVVARDAGQDRSRTVFSRSASALATHTPHAHGTSRATNLGVSLADDSASNLVGTASGYILICTDRRRRAITIMTDYKLLKKGGGSVWESNPPSRGLAPITGFEVQAAHQHRYASNCLSFKGFLQTVGGLRDPDCDQNVTETLSPCLPGYPARSQSDSGCRPDRSCGR